MCDVCEGSGEYPVIDRYGRELYTITCPECSGAKGDLFVVEHDAQKAFRQNLEALKGQPLGAEFERVWDDNVSKLYEE